MTVNFITSGQAFRLTHPDHMRRFKWGSSVCRYLGLYLILITRLWIIILLCHTEHEYPQSHARVADLGGEARAERVIAESRWQTCLIRWRATDDGHSFDAVTIKALSPNIPVLKKSAAY